MDRQLGKALPIASFHALIADGEHFGLPMRIWASAPRSYFASDRDHRRWNERFSGKPLDEAEGAFRVRLVERQRGFKRWHVEIAVGLQRFSLSSHDDRAAAERDAHLFGSLFDPNACRFTPEERAQLEAMRGPGESFMDVVTPLVKEMALTKRA
jgi:hypothetical protein